MSSLYSERDVDLTVWFWSTSQLQRADGSCAQGKGFKMGVDESLPYVNDNVV